MSHHQLSATGEAIGWLVAAGVIAIGYALVRFIKNHPHHDDHH